MNELLNILCSLLFHFSVYFPLSEEVSGLPQFQPKEKSYYVFCCHLSNVNNIICKEQISQCSFHPVCAILFIQSFYEKQLTVLMWLMLYYSACYITLYYMCMCWLCCCYSPVMTTLNGGRGCWTRDAVCSEKTAKLLIY